MRVQLVTHPPVSGSKQRAVLFRVSVSSAYVPFRFTIVVGRTNRRVRYYYYYNNNNQLLQAQIINACRRSTLQISSRDTKMDGLAPRRYGSRTHHQRQHACDTALLTTTTTTVTATKPARKIPPIFIQQSSDLYPERRHFYFIFGRLEIGHS